MRNQEPGTRNQDVGAAKGFRNLIAWQKADQLAAEVYRAVRSMPSSERWLRSQTVRAAISVPANIAEGNGRGSLGDYLRFLDIARGSLSELEYYLHFLRREGLIEGEPAERLTALQDEVSKILYGLWKSLKQKSRDSWNRTGQVKEEHEHYVTEPADNSGSASNLVPRS